MGKTAVEVYGHHLHTRPVPPHERLGIVNPTRLDQIILSCLEKSSDARPQSAAAVARLLDECEDVPAWTAERARAWWERHGSAVRVRREQRASAHSTVESEQTVAVNWQVRQAAG